MFTDSVILGCSNVGTISDFDVIIFSIIQYKGNTTGIIYNNSTKVLLSNLAWHAGNTSTFEKFIGNFTLIEKQGGFSEVNGSAIGVDVLSNPKITDDAIIETVIFNGTLTTGSYVKGYTVGNYPSFNFNNLWNVRCTAIPTETDKNAVGNYFKASNTTVNNTVATTQNQGYKVVTGTTSAINLFRFTGTTDGRLTYKGKKTRIFKTIATISFVDASGGNSLTTFIILLK